MSHLLTVSDAIATHARGNPDDPDALAMLERSRTWQSAFEQWGKRTLGFALLLFQKQV